MQTGKTKKKVKRLIAFLLCVIMVLGVGTQEIIGRDVFVVNAEEPEGGSGEAAPEEESSGEEPAEEDPPSGTEPQADEPSEPSEETAPEETLPEGTTPEETPEETLPEGTTPEETPEETPPDGTIPEETLPEGITPPETLEETLPEGTTPPETPEETLPEGTTPPETPEETLPEGTTLPETPEETPPETAEETTPEESTEETTSEESEEEETDPVTELVYEGEGFRVAATALEDVDLRGIEMYAAPAATEKAAELICEAKPGMDVAGILAYEISFTYEETGEAADLSGQAAITIEYTAPELEEGLAEKATLAMFSVTDESVSELTEAEGTVLGGGTAEVPAGSCDLYALAWLIQQEQAYDEIWEDEDSKVIIHVTAGAGVIPKGAELSVTPIVYTEITKELTAEKTDEELAEIEAINAQYEFTEQKLTEDLGNGTEAASEANALPADEENAAAETTDASEAEGKSLEGFLAYDICFLSDGEEAEPKGDVNVTMEFVEDAMPEGVSEDAEVSVKHLKQDESAESGIVVEDMTEKATVETTEQAKVQRVELTTDSFSIFTVIWTLNGEEDGDYKVELKSHYGYLDSDGKFVKFKKGSYNGQKLPDRWQDGRSDKEDNYNGGDYYLSEYADNVSENSKNYYFTQGYVVAGENGEFSAKEPAISISINDTNDDKTNYYIYRQTTKDHWEMVGEALKQKETNYLHIYFVYKELTGNPSLTINFVEKDGEAVDEPEPITISWDDEQYGDFFNTNGLNLEEYGTDAWCPEGYYLIVARLDNLDGTDAGKIRYFDNEWGYTDESEGFRNWSGESNEREVYLIYGRETSDTLAEVETVENLKEDYGISISMQNLDFKGDDAALDVALDGQYNNSGEVHQGLVKSTLESGYPKTTDGTSLEPLFNDGTEAGNFFIKKTLEDEGYFEYSSFENYACLKGDQFTIYNQMGAVRRYEKAGETEFYFHRGNFLPYNGLTGEKSLYLTNLYDEDGNKIDRNDEKFGKQLYLSDGVDYHFSMQMTANFLQPKGGITDRDEEMVFEFNGDDDMWVYINDVLILDIGGEHDAHSGTINFATGVVTVNISATQTVTTSLNKLYEDAEVFPDGSDWNKEKINDYFVDTGKTDSAGEPIYRFKDYEKYTMKMFYMERGSGASNLHIRFNLQTVPDGAVTVAKELSNTDKEKYANEDFQFELYVQKKDDNWSDTNPSYKDEYVKVTEDNMSELEITAELRQNGTSPGDLRWKGGTFLLKPGQSVVFSGLSVNRLYYVKEVGVVGDNYDKDKFQINDVTVKEYGQDGDSNNGYYEINDGILINITSGKETVENRPMVTFTNNCSDQYLEKLYITKKMIQGQKSEDTFTFKILLESTASSAEEIVLEEYIGDYYLTDSKGSYYSYDENGELTKKIEKTVCGSTDKNGEVSGVPVDYTVSIEGLLPGTQFHVYELGLSTEIYKEPVYGMEDAGKISDIDSVEEPEDTDKKGVYGEILNNNDEYALVTVTNELKPQIFVEKEWTGLTPSNTTVYVGLYEDNTPVADKYLALNDDNHWSGKFTGLEEDKAYTVKELTPATEKDGDFKIGDNWYVGVEDGGSITVSKFQYTVDYSGPTEGDLTGNQQNITITNTPKWQIVKRSTSDPNLRLDGAEFELTNKTDGFTLTGSSNESGVIEWENANGTPYDEVLPKGIYTLTETAAPVGYMLGADWKIEIENGIPTRISSSGSDGANIGSGSSGSEVIIDDVTFYNDGGVLTLYYDDEILYELPSSGGPGIYQYMLGGALLLMTGALMVYNERKKEVSGS